MGALEASWTVQGPGLKTSGQTIQIHLDISCRWDMTPTLTHAGFALNMPCDPWEDCPFLAQFPHLQHLRLNIPLEKTPETSCWEFSQEEREAGVAGLFRSTIPGSGCHLMSNLEQLLRGLEARNQRDSAHVLVSIPSSPLPVAQIPWEAGYSEWPVEALVP